MDSTLTIEKLCCLLDAAEELAALDMKVTMKVTMSANEVLWMVKELIDAQDKIAIYESVAEDSRRLTRELDVALNGAGAAPQASLCDIVSQVGAEGIKSVNYKQVINNG